MIELLVVMVILGILSTVMVPNFLNQIRRARTAEASTFVDGVIRGQQIHRLYNGIYATVGNVIVGDEFARVESGDSTGIVTAAGNVGDISTLLGVEVDPSFTTRWNFGTRPTNTSPPRIKVAVEGIGNTKAELMGVYFDGASDPRFAIDFENQF